jgi:Tfp pilus assembly protein PilF
MLSIVCRPSRARGYRFAAWLVLLGSLWPVCANESLAKEKWINLQTKNFNIVSDASEGATRQLALKLEQFQHITSLLFNIKRPFTVPITVIVFKDDGAFRPFKPLYNGKPANIAGYFQRGDDESMIALNIGGNEQHPMYVIFHEYTHVITSYIKRPWPVWLNEGVAELYSTFEVNENKVDLGRPVENHVRLLRENKLIPLQALFSVDLHSPAYNEREKQGIFYAESWALVHYLMFGDKSAHRPQFLEFVKLLDSGVSGDKAFTQVFGSDLSAVEKGLRQYVNGNFYAFVTATLDATVVDTGIAIQPLAEADVQYYLGSLLLHTNRPDDAVPYFKQAAALDPASPHSYEGLGFVAIRHDSFADAAAQFKQAVAHGSDNYMAHYYYAEALLRGQPGGPGVVDAETAKTVSEELKRSIKLMPGFAQSYYLLGNLCLARGENLEQGLQWAKTAVQLDPQKKHFALTLAHLQFRTGAYGEARATLALVLAGEMDPQMQTSAQSLSAAIDARAKSGASSGSTNTAGTPSGSGPPRLLHKDRVEDSDDPPPMPTLKIDGTDAMSGVLTAIECTGGKSVVLLLRTEAGVKRFAAPDLTSVRFLASTPSSDVISCGPMNRPVVLHFKPAASGQTKYAGEVVAVEFKQ